MKNFKEPVFVYETYYPACHTICRKTIEEV